MSINMPGVGLRQARHTASYSQLCSSLRLLQLSNPRNFTTSSTRFAAAKENEVATTTPKPKSSNRATAIVERTMAKLKAREAAQRANVHTGGLAEGSVFSEPSEDVLASTESSYRPGEKLTRLAFRNMDNLAVGLIPRPLARARWQRKMVVRHVRKAGRLTREQQSARTERKHLSRSHFMKTSMKKMMMLSRQIAGKSIDEAILQMRFSKKRVAQQVLQQLVAARNEAIVIKGMGQGAKDDSTKTLPTGPMVEDASTTEPESHQTPTKTLKKGEERSPTDIYIAQSWINRGPYGREPEYRARGRMNIRRPPHTGISLLLKEEKTRTREVKEKEIRAIRRRLGKGAWVQLPDRPGHEAEPAGSLVDPTSLEVYNIRI